MSINVHYTFMQCFMQGISNADFWQISGIAAIELGLENAGISLDRMKLSFKSGRIDCSTSPNDNERHFYPDASMNRFQMMKWFKDTQYGFGMNENEVRC